MGRKEQSVGKSFEELIWWSAWHDWRVTLVKQYPEMQFVQGRPIVTAKAAPDFLGWIGDRAAGIVFDAKSTGNKTTFYAPAKRRHQWGFMRDVAERHKGILTFYLVEWRRFEEFEVFPVRVDSPWPFVMRRGQGVFSTHDLGEVWHYLLDVAEGRKEGWHEREEGE